MSMRMTKGGRVIIFGLIILTVVGIFYNYAQKNPDKVSSGMDSPLFGGEEEVIKIGGSTMMSEHLIPGLAKNYLETNGYKNVEIEENESDIEVTGTNGGKVLKFIITSEGNHKGMDNLDKKEIDICMSSEEAEDTDKLMVREVAMDAIGIVVNKENPINSLTEQEVREIFSGVTKNNFTVYHLDDDSEYNELFHERILLNKPMASSSKEVKTQNDMIEAVSKDKDAIGFLGYDYLEKGNMKVLHINEFKNYTPMMPTELTIQSERYPFSIRFYMFMDRKGPAPAMGFIKWIETNDGQKAVASLDFINFDVQYVEKKDGVQALETDPKEYKDLVNNAKNISSEFRFETGSAELDPRAHDDIDRVIKFMAKGDNRKGKVVLVGFTDNVGDQSKNVPLSIQRANALKSEFESHGLKIDHVVGLGAAHPIRDNSTEDGKQENRRVEFWVIK